MKVVLYNAISLDGFIADTSGDSDWVTDDMEFEAKVNKIGCILIGRKTFEQYKGEIYPLSGAVNFVYTHEPERYNASNSKHLHFVGGSPQEVLGQIKQAGFNKILLGGGSATNASFAHEDLIDELILDVHPIVLGQGKKLLGDYTEPLKFKLISSQQNPKGYIQNHYRIIKLY